MDVPPAAIEAPLQELVDQFVLDPPGLRGLYDFRHQLLRDALYRTIPTRNVAVTTPGPASSGHGSREQSEIHASVHYERAGLRREALRCRARRRPRGRPTVGAPRGVRAVSPRRRQHAGRPRPAGACADPRRPAPTRRTRSRSMRSPRTMARGRRSPTARPATGARDHRARRTVLTVWRRDGRPVSERLGDDRASLSPSSRRCPTRTPVSSGRRALCLAIGPDRHGCPRAAEARASWPGWPQLGDELGDPEWRVVAEWKSAARRRRRAVTSGRDRAHGRRRARGGATRAGRSPACPPSAMHRPWRAGAMDYADGDPLDRRRACATPTRSSSRIART